MTPPPAEIYEFIGRLKGYAKDAEGAVATFSAGLLHHPDDARLYRHRGHRYLSLRRFAEARDDFLRAAELLPAWTEHIEYGQAYVLPQLEAAVLGAEAAANHPVLAEVKARGEYYSPLAFKVHYHLGLSWHLLGDDPAALRAFELALEQAVHQELLVATANWLVVLHGRLGLAERDAALLASIDLDAPVHTNAAYADLLRLYAGRLDAASLTAKAQGDPRIMATQGYGLGSFLLAMGRPDQAMDVFRAVVSQGDPAAFGTLAAELRLAEKAGAVTVG